MKRSEMLMVIEDVLSRHDIPSLGLAYVAECVLQSIEGGNKSGIKMLPNQFIFKNCGVVESLESVIFHEDLGTYGSIGWEEE